MCVSPKEWHELDLLQLTHSPHATEDLGDLGRVMLRDCTLGDPPGSLSVL